MSCFKVNRPSFNTCMHLFDHVVKPVLIYGADICGHRMTKCKTLYNEIVNDIFEKCHLKFLRYTLGVNKYAPILGLYKEAGRYPIYISSVIMYIKFWYRLTDYKEGLLYEAYMENQNLRSIWWKDINNLLNMINCCPDENIKSKQLITKLLNNFLTLTFREGWYKQLYNDTRKDAEEGNKLRCYRSFKSFFITENYLGCKKFSFRQATLYAD